MTDAPFTEPHRETLKRALDVGTSAWEPFELTTAIRAALKEIDRLTAENLALWTERQARIFPEQLRQAEAEISRKKGVTGA